MAAVTSPFRVWKLGGSTIRPSLRFDGTGSKVLAHPRPSCGRNLPCWLGHRIWLTCRRHLLHSRVFLLAAVVVGMTLLLRSSASGVVQADELMVEEGREKAALRTTRVSKKNPPLGNETIIVIPARANNSRSDLAVHKDAEPPAPSPSPLQLQTPTDPRPPKVAPHDRNSPNFTKEMRHFAESYAHSYPDGDQFMAYVKTVIKRKWEPSLNNTNQFRRDIRAALAEVGKSKNVYLTKHNTPRHKVMMYYMAGKPAKIADRIWETLPNDSVFQADRFKVCSVVGSSGILKGSKCGEEIDRADFVFRFNLAPVRGFETDVGEKTNFTTLNPTFIMYKMNSIKNTSDVAKFTEALRQFQNSFLYLPGFAVSGSLRLLVKAAGVASDARVTKPVYGSPDHFLVVSNLWRKTHNSGLKWPSTGIYGISSLFDTCDRINVFGFWPFAKSSAGRVVPYHYNNNVKATKVHSFDKEFKTLLFLHEKGIINLHLTSCR
ncbi:CMP-N-acetylneuraminate-poly-alpha-2,8-sialyltransferase-like [Acanthaster planci]|uniref:CMP-N-acetylneuraminate-poly-alpha-2, 8-sialyltransferase-like n=1 Tax=Acanthaster planci TaxID=133434 RepID=A0A8B7YWC0_ACAPL|nr:CMP-N-acetylneuraminate-poly-alpha-2,8-sialyltransferase-like [Acanthaster planci]XP_022096982.1 CMP-N-acetylneuraminate-poly-alpha-2,8-sialyltransferase-like [Acanthaster planci]